MPVDMPDTRKKKKEKSYAGGIAGIEPTTSRTLSENYSTKPNPQVCLGWVTIFPENFEAVRGGYEYRKT